MKFLGLLVFLAAVVVGAVVAKQNETAGGVVFIVGVIAAVTVATRK